MPEPSTSAIADTAKDVLLITVSWDYLTHKDGKSFGSVAFALAARHLSRARQPMRRNPIGQVANRIAVMRRGRIVESGPAKPVLAQLQHEYTRSLLASVPTMQTDREK